MKKLLGLFLVVYLAMFLSGCAKTPQPLPIMIELPDCPSPASPLLPELLPALALDSVENVEILLERDDLIRRYIKGLRASLDCFSKQKGGQENAR